MKKLITIALMILIPSGVLCMTQGVKDSLVYITCHKKDSKMLSGTGFFIKGFNLIATAKHLDTGCETFSVHFQEGNKVSKYKAMAIPIKESDADIMLLTVPGKSFFDKGVEFAHPMQPVTPGNQVYAPSLIEFNKSLNLYVSYGRMASAFFGDLDMHILNMPIKKGQSGSPVLYEETNTLLGIASGYIFIGDEGHNSGHAAVTAFNKQILEQLLGEEL